MVSKNKSFKISFFKKVAEIWSVWLTYIYEVAFYENTCGLSRTYSYTRINLFACCTAAYVSLRDSYLPGDFYSLYIYVISRLCYFTSLRCFRILPSSFLPTIILTFHGYFLPFGLLCSYINRNIFILYRNFIP